MARKERTRQLVIGALIAAVYVGLTYLSNFFGLAYGPVQVRISEVLCVLPVFTYAAIPGLTVGCFIANIGSFNLVDLGFGTFATLTAAVLTYVLKNKKVKGIPIFSMLSPVIINAVVIGAEISLFYLPDGAFGWGFLISALEVGIGEIIASVILGIPFYFMMQKYIKKLQ